MPELPSHPSEISSFAKIQKFTTMLESIGGTALTITDLTELISKIDKMKLDNQAVICLSPELETSGIRITEGQTATELESIHTAFITASYGVAENGAVWITESAFVNRLVPFICQHLVILLDAKKIMLDMHEAYANIQTDKEGYGLFLAGPSKTADIEQSLVIGAHGARTTTVYLLNSK